MRASDEDRESVAERLRQAAVEGRLLAHELEERLARTFRARTYGDLDAVVSDIPESSGMQRRRARRGVSLLRGQPPAVIVVVVAVAAVAVLIAAALFVALWGGWLVIVAILTLVARRRLSPRRVHSLRSSR